MAWGCVDTLVKVSKAYAERGGDMVAAISRKKRATPPVEPKVTGEVEARLIALACSTPPAGHARGPRPLVAAAAGEARCSH
jgi:hypothetical protein